MSAPIPIVETLKPNINFQNKKSFKLISNNINYNLSISYINTKWKTNLFWNRKRRRISKKRI